MTGQETNDVARLRWRWLIRFSLLVATFVIGFWAGAWSISRDIRQRARQDLEVALRLSAPNARLDQLRREYSISPALREKEEASLYYLLAAREVEEGRDAGANYFLALHFLTRDCSLAQYYLREQIRVNASDPRLAKLVTMVKEKGCAEAARELALARSHQGPQADEKPHLSKVTLCDLEKNAKAFDGRVIRVTATVSPTAHYQMAASDPLCGPQTMAVVIPRELDGDPAIEDFRKMVYKGYPGQRNRVVAHLEGQFQSRPTVPTRVLSLSHVEVVTKSTP